VHPLQHEQGDQDCGDIQADIRGCANAACVRSAPKLAGSARRADGGELRFGAPGATTAAEAALSAGAEAAGRCVCAAVGIV